MKIYIAAPVFNEMERDRNSHLKKLLESIGFKVYLPQEDAGLVYDLIGEEKTNA